VERPFTKVKEVEMKRFALATSVAALLGVASVTGTVYPAAVEAQISEYVVEFALGSARLDNRAKEVIEQAASAFRSGEAASLELVGHADTTGPADLNQQLSEQRAENVRDALVAEGISPDAISVEAVGQDQLIVQTADGVAEQRNRVVRIELQQPPAPPVAEAPPQPMAEDETLADRFNRIQFTVAPYYGFNLSQDNHLAGGNLTASYKITPNIAIGGEQAIFYAFDANGVGGRSVGSIDYHFGEVGSLGTLGGVVPYVGVNAGYIYGSGVNDDFIYGPEIGINLGIINVKVAGDLSDAGLDDSTISATIGALFRF